jgi:hypothetical protein
MEKAMAANNTEYGLKWGEKIYESDKGDYLGRPWDGFYNNTKLPVASYFYILDLGDGSDKRNGTVSIIQK